MVYNPLAQTCLFDSGWRADRGADGRRRLQSEEDSVAVCAASTAEAVAKSEAATKQELQTQVEELKGRMESADAAHAAQTQELKEALAVASADAAMKQEQLQTELHGLRTETQELKAETRELKAETRELKALLRQLLDSKQAA